MTVLYNIPPLLTFSCFLCLAVWTLLRARRTKQNILFLLICVCGCFLYLDILYAFNADSAEKALRYSRIDHLILVYLLPIYIQFFHEYLHVTGREKLVRFAYGYAFLLMCFVPTPLYIETMKHHPFGFFARAGMIYPFFGIGGIAVIVYVFKLISDRIKAEKSSVRKKQLSYVFFGFGCMGLMNGLNVVPILGYSVYPPGNLSFIPLLIFYVGLFKYDLFDSGHLVRKGLVYSLITAALTGAYAVLIVLTDRLFKNMHFSDTLYCPLLFFLLITLIFGPLKTKVQTVIDRICFKEKFDFQKTIRQVSQLIVSVLDLNEIGERLTRTISSTIPVCHCSLFVTPPGGTDFIRLSVQGDGVDPGVSCISGDSALIRFMGLHHHAVTRAGFSARHSASGIDKVLTDMDALCAEIVLPMRYKNHLNGFIALGEKRSGDLFAQEDLDLLLTLSSQSAMAVENARSYKLVEDLNKNLEQKVQERTRELEAALDEKERTQELLVRSESLAAIGQLVAGVAHELNNPLSSVKSLVQSTIEDLQEGTETNDSYQYLIDDLQFADRELGRAKAIVASLLSLSRQTLVYSEPVLLNSVVQDALRILHNQYKYLNLEIREDYARDLPKIEGNFGELGQVVLNIIKNAIQAVADIQGQIRLKTGFDFEKNQVVFDCSDNGSGIDEDIRNDIFKPFFTTKPPGQGTGLGLYISHEIVRRHGGTLDLDDTAGKGARFSLRLPIS